MPWLAASVALGLCLAFSIRRPCDPALSHSNGAIDSNARLCATGRGPRPLAQVSIPRPIVRTAAAEDVR